MDTINTHKLFEEFLIEIYEHERSNTMELDYVPCSYCHKEIEVWYKPNGDIDRSNRVDTDCSTNDYKRQETYHITCWHNMIFDED